MPISISLRQFAVQVQTSYREDSGKAGIYRPVKHIYVCVCIMYVSIFIMYVFNLYVYVSGLYPSREIQEQPCLIVQQIPATALSLIELQPIHGQMNGLNGYTYQFSFQGITG
jgi:hypothetical protein